MLWLPAKTAEHDPSDGAGRERMSSGYIGNQGGNRTESSKGG